MNTSRNGVSFRMRLLAVTFRKTPPASIEKPLTHTIAEARELREMSRTAKVITQTGNQGSASPNLRRSMELIGAGFFGAISDIHVWHPTHGWPSGEERPAGNDPIPATLDWDFWLGTAPERAYKTGIYHPAKWRGWYDFGNGSLGDFCCHGFNLPVRALRQRVGMIFQSFNLFPHLDVGHNVMLAPALVKAFRGAPAEARARQLLERVGLAEKFDAYPDQLSGGQQQRVAIARALMQDPKIILADDEALIAKFPEQKGKVTVLTLSDGKVTSIAYWAPGTEGIDGFLK